MAPQLSLRPSVQPTGCSQSCVCVCVCVRCPLSLHTSVPVLKYNTLLVLLKNVKTQLGLRCNRITLHPQNKTAIQYTKSTLRNRPFSHKINAKMR